MPKVTIDLPEPYYSVLIKWASVGRTLRTAQTACNIVGSGEQANDSVAETSAFCSDELDDLIPALEALHHHWRSLCWEADRQVPNHEQIKAYFQSLKVSDHIRQIRYNHRFGHYYPDKRCLSCGELPLRAFRTVNRLLQELDFDRPPQLCRGCFEKRLGRALTLEDLIDHPQNDWLVLELMGLQKDGTL